MIDVHTHILPGIDDGAKTPSIGAELLRLDLEQGVKEVVFTPHYYGKKRHWKEFLRDRETSFNQIKELVPAGMKTRLGADGIFLIVSLSLLKKRNIDLLWRMWSGMKRS